MCSMSCLVNFQQEVSALLSKHLVTILEDVAKRYELDADELKERYMTAGVGDADKKKRGRKKKQKDEYIETVEVEFEGTKYLVDDQNNVYTHNIEAPALVGERLVDGTIRLFA